MRHKLISSRWKYMVIISSVFLTLNTVVFGGERKILFSLINISYVNILKKQSYFGLRLINLTLLL